MSRSSFDRSGHSRHDFETVVMPYGAEEAVSFTVPARNLLAVLLPPDHPPVSDLATEVRRALAEPIGAARLRQLARDSKNAVIIADDNTRLTPTHEIVPILLDEMNAGGVPDARITLIVALGTHRAMTAEEIRTKFGSQVVGRIRVINHDCGDPEVLVDLGATEHGTPIAINRLVCEADFCIGVGSVYPHHIPGFAGGAKIVQPGVSGAQTTGATHLLGTRARPTYLGRVDNPVRREMEAVARRAGVNVILNTVQNASGRTAGAFYGDLQAAFREAANLSARVLSAPFSAPADVVVAGSYPADIEFWQAHKALYPAEMAAKPDGTLIIVTPCPEGVSVMHPEMLEYTASSPEEIEAGIASGRIRDVPAGALALGWSHVRQGRQVSIVSDGLSAEEARCLGFVPFRSVSQALDDALRRHGPDAKVSVLPRAAETLPVYRPL